MLECKRRTIPTQFVPICSYGLAYDSNGWPLLCIPKYNMFGFGSDPEFCLNLDPESIWIRIRDI